MQVIVVDDDASRQVNIAIAFMRSGYQVTPTSSLRVAEACVQRGNVDLLVMVERLGDRLTHSLALMAEYHHPMVSTMMLTARADLEADELFSLLPSLHCMLPLDAAPELITRLALASMTCSTAPLVLEPSMMTANTPSTPAMVPLRFQSARSAHANFGVVA